jgi:hypothetical protein
MRPYKRSIFILSWRGLVEHPADLPLLLLRQGCTAGDLGLQQRPEKHAVVPLGANGTQIAVVQPISYPLGLEDLRLSFSAPLAFHVPSISGWYYSDQVV